MSEKVDSYLEMMGFEIKNAPTIDPAQTYALAAIAEGIRELNKHLSIIAANADIQGRNSTGGYGELEF